MSAINFRPVRDEHHIMMALENGARFVDEIERGIRCYRPETCNGMREIERAMPQTMDMISRCLRTLVARDVVKSTTWSERWGDDRALAREESARDHNERTMYKLTPDGAALLAKLRGEAMALKLSRSP